MSISYWSVDLIRLRSCLSSSVSSRRLCVFSFHGAIYIVNISFLITSFVSPFSELSLVGLAFDLVDYPSSFNLWCCWLGHLTCKIVSKMTCNVSSWVLNPTIPTIVDYSRHCRLDYCNSVFAVQWPATDMHEHRSCHWHQAALPYQVKDWRWRHGGTSFTYGSIDVVAMWCSICQTRGQSNLTKSASRGAQSSVKGHPRGSKFVPIEFLG